MILKSGLKRIGYPDFVYMTVFLLRTARARRGLFIFEQEQFEEIEFWSLSI